MPGLQIRLFLLANSLLPAFVAHRNVEIVATEEKLVARGNYIHIRVKTSVDNRLRAAGANSLDLGYRVGKLKEPSATREEMTEEVGTKSEAKHGDITIVYDFAQSVNVRLCQELTFINYNYVAVGMLLGENLVDIVIYTNGIASGKKTNA